MGNAYPIITRLINSHIALSTSHHHLTHKSLPSRPTSSPNACDRNTDKNDDDDDAAIIRNPTQQKKASRLTLLRKPQVMF
ncbi:hypothetical protein EUGRSUZ_J00267 [Eucalyptus grandis]|uniref:Uncharacterized protein n=2 Tax=Eucalyptus grandis TaxID=71139 RepID=A0ACC3J2M4_EUCGR|nr:hypothetical protein EUGRSUZ_J00267 [Eucalyptus grandis]